MSDNNNTIHRIDIDDIFDDDGELTPMRTSTPPPTPSTTKIIYKPNLPSVDPPPPRQKRSSPPPRNLQEITDDIGVDETSYKLPSQVKRLIIHHNYQDDDEEEYELALTEFMNKNNL